MEFLIRNLILKSYLLPLRRLTEILLQQTIISDPFHELRILSRSKVCAFKIVYYHSTQNQIQQS